MSSCSPKPDLSSTTDEAQAQPPVAECHAKELRAHGETRIDEYYWLRDDQRSNPQVLAYLHAENAYAESVLEPVGDLRQALFEELKGRVKEDDASVPYRLGNWFYRARYAKGDEHPVYLRRPVAASGEETVILDVNELAKGHDYYHVEDIAVSRDGRYLAYAEDTVGREEYVIRVADLETGAQLPDIIAGTSGDIAWCNDNRTLYYVRLQEGSLIPYQVRRRRIGDHADKDVLVFEEFDDRFGLEVAKSRDEQWIVVASTHTLSDEYRLIDANEKQSVPIVVHKREPGHEYTIEPDGGDIYILTNWHAINFRLMKTRLDAMGEKSAWDEVIPARDNVLLEDFLVFKNYLVVNERTAGILSLRIINRRSGESRSIDVDEEACTMAIDVNPGTDTEILRYAYSSMATPDSVIDHNMRTGEQTLRKIDEVPGYDSSDYRTLRMTAEARDGQNIPITLLYRDGVIADGSNPLYQVGYGAYGISYDPEFGSDRLSLVDRGFVVAIAHIRGGEDCGRPWYFDGRLLHKKNSFTDFIDVTEWLIRKKWANPDKIVAQGGSAGGLLMGAIANMRPDLYAVLIADVPFVDIVTTTFDQSIPLVTFEYDEWGNPLEKAYYDYMKSYSPYDNVEKKGYPHLLVTAGIHDPRVQYWEAAKWVARLRANKTNQKLLLLKTNMEAGHFDAAGRFEVLKEAATRYAFMLDRLGMTSAVLSDQ